MQILHFRAQNGVFAQEVLCYTNQNILFMYVLVAYTIH